MDRELDIARSLADREFLLFHLDIEYVNFDSPLTAYEDPGHAFAMQEPAVWRFLERALGAVK